MPNQIKIESGLTAGTCYWMNKNVTRIGSGTNADICLPSSEIPAHAMTLEYRNDLYRVYNRTKRSLVVGNADVAPGEAADWLDGETIALPDGTNMTLHLDVEYEDSDEPMLENADADEVDEIDVDDLGAVESTRSSRRLDPAIVKQLLVLAGCIGAMLFFLGNIDGTSTVPSSQFDQIIEAGLQDEKTSRPLLQELRFAEAALVRKDTELADYLFRSMHTKLVSQKSRFVKEDRAVELAILNYVQSRAK